LVENIDFFIPIAFYMPPLQGVLVGILPLRSVRVVLTLWKRFDDRAVSTENWRVTDRRTDRQANKQTTRALILY